MIANGRRIKKPPQSAKTDFLPIVKLERMRRGGNPAGPPVSGSHRILIASGGDCAASAPDLIAVGAFCIGVNQIDLAAASGQGVAVFNAPFSNTRSVVELVLAEIIALTRRLTDKNTQMHAGVWDKSAAGSHGASRVRAARPKAQHHSAATVGASRLRRCQYRNNV